MLRRIWRGKNVSAGTSISVLRKTGTISGRGCEGRFFFLFFFPRGLRNAQPRRPAPRKNAADVNR